MCYVVCPYCAVDFNLVFSCCSITQAHSRIFSLSSSTDSPIVSSRCSRMLSARLALQNKLYHANRTKWPNYTNVPYVRNRHHTLLWLFLSLDVIHFLRSYMNYNLESDVWSIIITCTKYSTKPLFTVVLFELIRLIITLAMELAQIQEKIIREVGS